MNLDISLVKLPILWIDFGCGAYFPMHYQEILTYHIKNELLPMEYFYNYGIAWRVSMDYMHHVSDG